MEIKKNCCTCKYWFNFETKFGWRKGAGSCRKSAPMVDQSGDTSWPETNKDDWCGEWTQKSEE